MNERKISQVSADSFLSYGTVESEDFNRIVHQEEAETVSSALMISMQLLFHSIKLQNFKSSSCIPFSFG